MCDHDQCPVHKYSHYSEGDRHGRTLLEQNFSKLLFLLLISLVVCRNSCLDCFRSPVIPDKTAGPGLTCAHTHTHTHTHVHACTHQQPGKHSNKLTIVSHS